MRKRSRYLSLPGDAGGVWRRETSRQLRTAPELLGLERQSDEKLIAKLESAGRTFVEASDALDWAISGTPLNTTALMAG